MKKFYLWVVALLCSATAFPQDGAMQATSFSTATYVREIPALSSMDNIIAAAGFEDVAPPKRRGTNTFVEGKGLPAGADPLARNQQLVPRAAARAPITSFDAHLGTVLNDPTGAIGPNHYVYAFNSGFGILDRAGNVLLPEASLGTIFPGETLGDPVVLYDRYADRFIIMEFSDTPNGFLVAIGQGPDPINDGWYTYRFNTGSFPDYEKMSIWADGYYITANKDASNPTANDVIFALERDEMLVGNPSAQVIGFPLPGVTTSGFYSPGGFNVVGPNLPPLGTPHPLVYMQDDGWTGVSSDHLKIWNVSVDWTNPSASSISTPQEITTAPFDAVFDGGSFQNLEEPGSGPDIDAIQATMMYMTNYRRFGTHNSAVMNFVVDVTGTDSQAGIRWYELRQTADGAPWTIYQEGTYVQPDGHSAFCGSIGIDAAGNIGMGYTIVSPTVYTSLRYTGRQAGDPLGTMTLNEQFIVDGDQPTAFRPDGRYGDYAHLTVDPLDDMTFWHIAEYMKGTTNTRKSHVAAFKINSGPTDTEAPTAPSALAASNETAVSVDLTWTASTDNVAVVGYDIYQDGVSVGTVGTPGFTVTGLSPETSYDFYVVAKDAAGNQSGQSNTVNATTLAASGCTGGVTSYPYAESFENTIGAWTQSTTDDLNWTVLSGSTGSSNTGPAGAQDGNYYIYVEASGNGTGYPNKTAVITSPCFDLSSLSTPSFNFRVHQFGSSDMGTILLQISNDDGINWTTLWSQSGNQGNAWSAQNIDLTTYAGQSVQLRFSRTTGSTWQADIALDNISLTDGVPATTSCSGGIDSYPYNEGYENTIGAWSQSGADDLDWRVQTGRTPSGNTGPSSANQGSYYIYVEASGNGTGYPNKQAVITSPCFDLSGATSASFEFDYHMYGASNMGTFLLEASADNGDSWNAIWSQTGNQGNQWNSVSVDLADYLGSGLQLRFNRTTGSTWRADIAVDAVSLISASSRSHDEGPLRTYALDKADIFSLYPNPTKDVLHLETSGIQVNELQVFSALGRQVMSLKQLNSGMTINVSHLPAGTYFVRFVANEQVVTKQFIKE
ncbi:T9SS type A sorting domain-containing protein [Gilvibacter sediminis]|uniref:T9SS type A sorting domain-containing protein n=1 Tax=Gilvibacter sediminis TaxID=379071 RepID=UPI002350535D|nr:T9SS type A sorting domain-containing protein [Gilvibacter sediminis]MDC7998627.1 T9SS type A sorting domain-containing protein [Gilvibacter sediminis]